MRYNTFNQPIGEVVANHCEGEEPNITSLVGETVTIEKTVPSHFEDLFLVYGELSPADSFTYMSFDKFEQCESFEPFFNNMVHSKDPYYLTIIDNQTKRAVGSFSLLRMDTNNRVIEIGWVVYSPELKRTKQATEAQFLVMKYVFEVLCYRRYEWKCDCLNAPSNHAAKRLGFTFEGTFRQAVVYKGRNRDTNWYSIIDKEWSDIKNRFEKWLDASNFDASGQQIKELSTF